MSRRTMVAVIAVGAAVLLTAGLAAAAGTGKTSSGKKCASASETEAATRLSCRNQGEETLIRSERCEQAAAGECAGDCERLRERLRERDGDGECPCEGTGERYRNGVGTPAGEEAPGCSGEASYRCGDGYNTGGASSGNCAGDCLRVRERVRDCAEEDSGGA